MDIYRFCSNRKPSNWLTLTECIHFTDAIKRTVKPPSSTVLRRDDPPRVYVGKLQRDSLSIHEHSPIRVISKRKKRPAGGTRCRRVIPPSWRVNHVALEIPPERRERERAMGSRLRTFAATRPSAVVPPRNFAREGRALVAGGEEGRGRGRNNGIDRLSLRSKC